MFRKKLNNAKCVVKHIFKFVHNIDYVYFCSVLTKKLTFMNYPQFYYLRLFKSSGRYLRISRNACFTLRCPASLLRNINEHDYLVLVGNKSLNKFVIVGLNDKPTIKVGRVYEISDRTFVDERIKFRMRQLMNKYLFTSYNYLDESWLNVIEQYDEIKPLFS